MNLQQLLELVEQGPISREQYLFFWGEKSPLSNWNYSPYKVGSLLFQWNEKWMMWRKAEIFGDAQMSQEILAAQHPRDCKKLGRKVRGYDDEVWKAHRQDVMREGLMHKFKQNDSHRAFLLDSDDKIIVEASPTDTIWGVGLRESDPRILDPQRWRGTNLLGEDLMWSRGELS